MASAPAFTGAGGLVSAAAKASLMTSRSFMRRDRAYATISYFSSPVTATYRFSVSSRPPCAIRSAMMA